MSIRDHYTGRKCIIATMHGKEKVLAPILEYALGVEIYVPKNFDSDAFGSFTREVERTGNQYEAAKNKLLAAMKLYDIDIGVSSEGTFGPDLSCPFIALNGELVLFIDKKNGHEVSGYSKSHDTNFLTRYVSSVQEAVDFAQEVGFPEHGVIVRQHEKKQKHIYKNIKTESELKEKVSFLLKKLFVRKVFLETDMRADKNPTRMKNIQKAGEDLIQNIASLCPACSSPGFSIVNRIAGLPCCVCKSPTELPTYDIYRCHSCEYELKRNCTLYGLCANPGNCGFCNP